jgi:hypothetical protein
MRRTVVGLLAFLCCCNAAAAVHAQDREPDKVRKKNAFIGFGLGIAGYWPDTGNLSAAFTRIEEFYRDQGYYIPFHMGFNPSPLVTYSLRLQFASPIGLVVEAAQGTRDGQEVDAISATLLVELVRDRGRKVRPYLGAGVTDVSFELTHIYKAQISGTIGDPTYSTLDHITANGRSTGANFIGGLQVEFLRGRFIFQGAYWLMPELSDDFGTGVTTTVNLSSVVLSAQLMLTLP